MSTEYYKTSDIVLAAYLKLSGHRIVRIEKTGTKGTFVFENIQEEDISEYDLGKALVEPQLFNSTIRTLTTSVRRIS